MRRSSLLLVLALIGCDDESAPPAATAAPRPAVTSFASLGGMPVPFASVLAFSRGGEALQILASTHEVGCDDLRGAYVREAGEVTVELTLAPRLADEGWSVTRLRLGKTTRQGDLGAVSPEAVDPSRPVRVALGASGPWGDASRPLRLEGTLEARGCGVIPSVEVPPRAQGDLRMSVDGRALTVRGASYDAGARLLRLSTEPHDCKGGLGQSDVALSLNLGEEAGVERAKLEGYRLARTAGGSAEGLSAQRDDESSRFALTGKAEIGGLAVELSGTVDAFACAPD